MEELGYSAVLLVVFFALLGSGIWIAFCLLGVAFVGMSLFTPVPVGQVMATSIWGSSNAWPLAAIPMFIWMGEILSRSRVSEDLFNGLAPWMRWIPGGLVHVNILGCGLFAAVSGSSVATAATIGKMSIPELLKRGYPPSLVLGSLAGSGTLGFLIPPSVILIVYGVAIEESIVRLFLAGVLPGLLLLVLFTGYVILWSVLNPRQIPRQVEPILGGDIVRRSIRLLPILLLIFGVLGSIYLGIASPTDAAAVGVGMALLIGWLSGSLTRTSFIESLFSAIRTSCMITFILAAASFLTVVMGFTGIPRALAEWIGTMQLSPTLLICVLTVAFIVLGCFLDGISIVVLTTAVILPMIDQAGIDRIWFGVYLAIVVEMSQITPPVGFNLFALQGLTGHNILYLTRAAAPFFFILLLAIGIIVVFPDIAVWLPKQTGH